MELVPAALADNVDLAGTVAVLGRVRTALHLEFLNRVLRQNHRRSNQSRIGVDQSVQRVVVAFGPATVDTHGVAFALAHGALLAAHRDRAGADQQQLHEVAPVQRKLFHLLLAHLLRQRRAVRVQSHGLGIDFDSGRNCARLEDHVNTRALVHRQDHAGGQ